MIGAHCGIRGTPWTLPQRLGAPRIGQVTAILAAITALSAVFLPTLNWMTDTATTTVIGMDWEGGGARLTSLGLPENSASDICYRSSIVGVTFLADFDISEADFLAWMQLQDWGIVPFDLNSGRTSIDASVHPVREYDPETPLAIERGYCFFTSKPNNPDNTTTVIYDLDTGRAYVRCTTY